VRNSIIARNYAEALLAAAGSRAESFGGLLDTVAGAIAADARIALALESPRVAKAVKIRVLSEALADVAPAEFVRFLQAVVRRGRQNLLGDIAREYLVLVDQRLNRAHAAVTLARDATQQVEQQIVQRLSTALGKLVRAHFRADPAILGGVIVRVGDRIFDGSIRRRLTVLRRKMLGAGA
jgi:F-type H+-transporting ATPase subunit delta